jgi:hypothetical protein
MKNVCRLVRSATHYFEVTNRHLTKMLRGHSHLLLVTTVDTTTLLNNELGAQQNQID